jgi:hypothetical protein
MVCLIKHRTALPFHIYGTMLYSYRIHFKLQIHFIPYAGGHLDRSIWMSTSMWYHEVLNITGCKTTVTIFFGL